jgi:Zn finger protein HypA/HybF involved in hydrogenase expression
MSINIDVDVNCKCDECKSKIYEQEFIYCGDCVNKLTTIISELRDKIDDLSTKFLELKGL